MATLYKIVWSNDDEVEVHAQNRAELDDLIRRGMASTDSPLEIKQIKDKSGKVIYDIKPKGTTESFKQQIRY